MSARDISTLQAIHACLEECHNLIGQDISIFEWVSEANSERDRIRRLEAVKQHLQYITNSQYLINALNRRRENIISREIEEKR